MDQRYFSQVYWHFTGSPEGIDWSKISAPIDIIRKGSIKSDERATDIAVAILNDKKLKASAEEMIASNLKSDKFCCVTDVPIKDLQYHGQYYGRVAIGFRGQPIHSKFLPVVYIPKDRLPELKNIIEPDEKLMKIALELLSSTGGWAQKQGETLWYQAQKQKKTQTIADPKQYNDLFRNLIKITEFSPEQGGSFYAEREWRHFGDFEFGPNDVEAVLAPEAQLAKFQTILREPPYDQHTITVLSWEFLSKA